MPLVAESGSVGALLLGFERAPITETYALVRALSDVAAAAIQRGQLYDAVTTQANRLSRVMESVNFGLLLLDPERRIVLVNQHVKMRLGHLVRADVGDELAELAGQKLGHYLTPSGNQSRTFEINVAEATYEITTVPVGASAAESGWLIVIHDVTRERAIQQSIQQHQRLAAVGQLAAGIAHDFNNIIAVILLYVQMLQRNVAFSDSDQNKLKVIRDQAQNASKLIRQIMDFSRQTVIEREPVDLKKLIAESMALWERTLPENIALHLDTGAVESAPILAEVSSLQQALTTWP